MISSSELFSYTSSYSGLGTDAIANRFTFSTPASSTGDGTLSLRLQPCAATRPSAGPPTEYTQVVNLSLDGTNVTFEPAPEASAALGYSSSELAALWRRRCALRRSSDLALTVPPRTFAPSRA